MRQRFREIDLGSCGHLTFEQMYNALQELRVEMEMGADQRVSRGPPLFTVSPIKRNVPRSTSAPDFGTKAS